jgi:hypothetical protein
VGPGLLAAALLLAGPARGNFGGRTGQSTAGCGECHGEAADPQVSAVLEGPTTAEPGALVSLRLVLTSTRSAHDGAGMNVAATAGALRPGEGTRLDAGELTHDRRQDMEGGAHGFAFLWRAPRAPGPHVLTAAANAVDGGGTARGDGWALAEPLSISVDCTPETCPEPDEATPDTGARDTGVGAAGGKPAPERGCGPPLGPALPVAALAAVLALGRRRP